MTERDEVGPPKEPSVQTVFQIEGVPLIKSRHGNWCGYSSLAIVLQYWGYPDINPEGIFAYIHGKKYDEKLEEGREKENKPTLAPTIDTLASVARELTTMNARILSEDDYKKIGNRSPQDVLNLLIKGRIPCIVRIPGHFLVATGIDTGKDTYIFNDPLNIVDKKTLGAANFEKFWNHTSPDYPRDTRHLMLAIYPKR